MTKMTTRRQTAMIALQFAFVCIGSLLLLSFYLTNSTPWWADIGISVGWLVLFWAVCLAIPSLIGRVWYAVKARRIAKEAADRAAYDAHIAHPSGHPLPEQRAAQAAELTEHEARQRDEA